METRLGKIKKIKFGHVGYNEAMIGVEVELGSDKESWGVIDNFGYWDYEILKRTEHTQWTDEERDSRVVDMVKRISELLKEGQVNSIDKLKGLPVECKFDGSSLKKWRILTEVI